MMNKMTYFQAHDKVIEAYYKDEIKPLDCKFCFCGTLSPDEQWHSSHRHKSGVKYPYTYSEYQAMENGLFDGMFKFIKSPEILNMGLDGTLSSHQQYENAIFEGMKQALEVLKQIHIARGENVEVIQEGFKKRQLETA